MNHEAPSPRGVAAFNGYRWMGVLFPLGALGYTFLTGTFGSLRALLWLPLGAAIFGGMVLAAGTIWVWHGGKTIKKEIAMGFLFCLVLIPLPSFSFGSIARPPTIQWSGLLFFFMGLPFWIFPNRLKAMIGPAGPYETMRLID